MIWEVTETLPWGTVGDEGGRCEAVLRHSVLAQFRGKFLGPGDFLSSGR